MPFVWLKRKTTPTWTDSFDHNGNIIRFNYSTDMTFYDEHNNKVDTVRFELPEQYLSSTYVEDDATVLELGARYGTVSCAINKKLKDKYKQVSVEPDQTVWNVLTNTHFYMINFILLYLKQISRQNVTMQKSETI
jgi:hypothetical protein